MKCNTSGRKQCQTGHTGGQTRADIPAGADRPALTGMNGRKMVASTPSIGGQKPARRRALSRRQRKLRSYLVAYSFIAPNFAGFAIFTLGPILFAFALAFMHWDGSNAITFAGLDNFWRLFEDKAFIAAFWNWAAENYDEVKAIRSTS